MNQKEKPNLSFETHSPVIAIFVLIIFGYGIGNFIVDLIYYLSKYYN